MLNHQGDPKVLMFGHRIDSCPFGQQQFFGIQRVHSGSLCKELLVERRKYNMSVEPTIKHAAQQQSMTYTALRDVSPMLASQSGLDTAEDTMGVTATKIT